MVSPDVHEPDPYDGTFPVALVLSPTAWLLLAWLCMPAMLYAVGYLGPVDASQLAKAVKVIAPPTDVDHAAQQAALAYSGTTLAITLVLSVSCLFWSFASFRRAAPGYRLRILGAALVYLVLSLAGSWWVTESVAPFTARLGETLLRPESAGVTAPLAGQVPTMMFVLACMVPCFLLAGAGFLLQPMPLPGSHSPGNRTRDQLKRLAGRLRELDEMLYVGALALVFGTLQLSAGLSVPLASLPRIESVKAQAELCKTLGPSAASSPFFSLAPPAAPQRLAVDTACQQLPAQFAKVEPANSLRQFVRGITLCFGLAFSALLAAVYVPALIGLRMLIEPRLRMLQALSASGNTTPPVEIGAVDPLGRVAAAVATLGPLVAGLLASLLGSG